MLWTYGVTTVPQRRKTSLPRTLESLSAAGFEEPRLFVDGGAIPEDWSSFDLPVTLRTPVVHAFGNFWMGLLEMWLRDPLADLFAMFQDDVLLCRNTRQLVEYQFNSTRGTENVYYNLFTCVQNEQYVASLGNGWHLSNQLGWGAQALVFPRDTLLKLFQNKRWVERALGMKNGEPHPERAWKNLDGGVISAVKEFGGRELVHLPSLVQHCEVPSALGNPGCRTKNGYKPWVSDTFPGENFDALGLLPQGVVS